MISLVIILILAVVVIYLNRQSIIASWFKPTESSIEQGEVASDKVKSVANKLDTPWSISFLPGGDMLISERNGQIIRTNQDGTTYEIANVRETSEGGLLGLALHPDFKQNRQFYLYYTTQQDGQLTNQIDRAKLVDDKLTERTTILSDIPAAQNHNGGAIEFGPDGKLYVTTGDAAQSDLAQDKQSLAGKILRLNSDGSVPDDNPFDNLVWSYGHRNPQGLAWDDSGQLWSVEHGPSGVQSGNDEVNKIDKGANYGWPVIKGDETGKGLRTPILQSGADETWAPSRLVFAKGKLYFTGLRGQSLYQVDISRDKPTIKRYFSGEYGRLRAITAADNTLYVGTSNRDGRGDPKPNDDQILSMPLGLFND